MGKAEEKERFLRARALFDEVCELETPERLPRLRELAAGDEELVRQVQELLAADQDADRVLGTSAAGALGIGGAADASTLEIPGFELGRAIGMGGMGVVYEARQKSPERSVAVKLLRPGWMTKESLRRFEDEARVLGWLSHPGIATVYEAGRVETALGPQPYLVMELVQGERVDEYVTREGLGIPDRLRLIRDICQAVHHAHQKGVVHRDLKPANILVTSEGRPKILDFGVARILDPDFETTRNTGAGEMLGTLPYMSPEQVRADPAQIDTRVDVYALGVLSYELLTSKRPHELESFALHEAARVILEEEPTGVGELVRELRGDVATMVHKAMAKEKERRYASAEEFAQDIQRHLIDEPIRAVPPSRVYLVRKFARRNRMLLAAAGLVFLGLTSGLVVALLGLRRAIDERDAKEAALLEVERERDQKELALRESERTSEFLADTLSEASPRQSGKDVLLRDVLDRAAGRIGADFADEPRVAARLFATVGRTYAHLGEMDTALDLLEQGYELSKRPAEAGAAGFLDNRHSYAYAYAAALREVGRHEEAEPLLLEALRLLEEEGGDPGLEASLHHQLGVVFKLKGEYDRAESHYRRSHEGSLELHGPDDDLSLLSAEALAILMSERGQLAEAQPLLEDLLQRHEAKHGPDHVLTVKTRYNLATLYSLRGFVAEALEMDERVLASRGRLLGERHPETAVSMVGVAQGYGYVGRIEEARELAVLAHEILGEVHGPFDKRTLTARSTQAFLCDLTGDADCSFEIYEELVEAYTRSTGPLHVETLRARLHLGLTLGRLEDFDSGIAILEEVFELCTREHGPGNRVTLAAGGNLGKVLAWSGRHAEAIEAFEEVRRRAEPSSAHEVALASVELALVLLEGPEELRDVERALQVARDAQVDVTRDRRKYGETLARALFAAGRPAEAAEVHATLPGLFPPMTEAERAAWAETLERYRGAAPPRE